MLDPTLDRTTLHYKRRVARWPPQQQQPQMNHPHRGTNKATTGAKHTARGPGDTERVHQVTQQAEPHQYHNITKLADKYAPPSFTDIYQGTEGLVQVWEKSGTASPFIIIASSVFWVKSGILSHNTIQYTGETDKIILTSSSLKLRQNWNKKVKVKMNRQSKKRSKGTPVYTCPKIVK